MIVDPAEIPHAGRVRRDRAARCCSTSSRPTWPRTWRRCGPAARVKTLADVIAFNEKNRDREMPCFGQELFLAEAEKGPLTDKAYLNALETSATRARGGVRRGAEQHQLDAIVAPTGGPAWLIDLVNGDHFGGGSSTAAAVAGYPNITVPAGMVHASGRHLVHGRAWSEPTLIRVAYAYEQATGHRQAPTFRSAPRSASYYIRAAVLNASEEAGRATSVASARVASRIG